MGNDGGSIARRDELVKVKVTHTKADPAQLKRVKWTLCHLSRQPLREPVVADALGRLYNKEAIVNWLIEKKIGGSGNGSAVEEKGMGHIRGLKDVTLLKLHTSPASRSPTSAESEDASSSSSSVSSPFSCPLTARPMNGSHRFVFLLSSGAVMSEAGLKAIIAETASSAKKAATVSASASAAAAEGASAGTIFECPVTSQPFLPGSLLGKNGAAAQDADNVGDVILLNPSEKEEDVLRAAMYKRREGEVSKKRKKDKGAGAGATAASNGNGIGKATTREEPSSSAPLEKKQKRLSPPGEAFAATDRDREERLSAPASATHLAALAAKQAKGKPMSAALASIYGHGVPKGEKEGWMVRGTGMGR